MRHQLLALLLPAFARCGGPRPPKQFDTCKGTSTDNPKMPFGLAKLKDPFGSTNESLVTAICCDSRYAARAEPQNLYKDVNLFASLDPKGTTTFYDSACGLPLFITPVNRTLAEFEADTTEHGWPSFREAEVVHENVMTNSPSAGLVTSACGTHLGSYLPDAKGPRWCMDLSCIVGTGDWAGCCGSCVFGDKGCDITGATTGRCLTSDFRAPPSPTLGKACDCAC